MQEAPDHVIALIGNPNVGKTTLLNRLAGLRAKTSNFPGTTQEAIIGRTSVGTIIDLPGIYALDLDQSEAEICRGVLDATLAPVGLKPKAPDTLLVVADATNLLRNLTLVGQATALGIPMGVAINLSDIAQRRGIHIDTQTLARRLGCPVVAVSARTGDGFNELQSALAHASTPEHKAPSDRAELERWADSIYSEIASVKTNAPPDHLTNRLDRAFTHPALGVLLFTLIMTGLFWVIFRLATYPMDWIDAIFLHTGNAISGILPEGAIRSVIVDGAIAGVGATVIFLPQILLLFFLLAMLEGTGYLARAAFVIDRLMRPFGLSGHAFVPMLSSHACALPGIMAARAVPDRRDRLATILCAPFMSCTARIPVYVLLTSLLFPNRPALQALAFTGCYVLGALAGLLSALIARRTIIRGASRPMALELPAYRVPDLRTAMLSTLDRGMIFLRKAGVFILAISVVLWWLGEYPHSTPPTEATSLRAQAQNESPDDAAPLLEEADRLETSHAARHSALGRLGSTLSPVFAPMGADRQLTVGILASFAAREVFVSTMAVQVIGSDTTEDEGVFDTLANSTRDDGSPIFTHATAWSLLVFYVLAMQCLPTLVVTAREAGHIKWALLQLVWMSGIAYALSVTLYQILRASGVA
ncbi:MAG: ferrous iron transporter B [Planctomycetota bacterium]